MRSDAHTGIAHIVLLEVVCEGLDPALRGPTHSLDVPRQLGILREIEVQSSANAANQFIHDVRV